MNSLKRDIIEFDNELRNGYIHSLKMIKDERSLNYLTNITGFERVGHFFVYKITNNNLKVSCKNHFIELNDLLIQMKCNKCRKDLQIKTFSRLPSHDWHELIDSWSCHNSEFKNLLNRKWILKPDNLLYSDFYCMFHETNSCCMQPSTRIFYNELFDQKYISNFIFLFFKDFFKQHNIYNLPLEITMLKITYFYECFLIKENKPQKALKVGFKTIPMIILNHERNVNDYFTTEIYNMLLKNSLGMKIGELEVSYIIQMN